MRNLFFIFTFGLLVSTTSIRAQDWVPIKIFHGTRQEALGMSVSLNSDGLIMAGGAPFHDYDHSGEVRVYQNYSGNWSQIGYDIDGVSLHGELGMSVNLNSDGSIVAMGAINGSYDNRGGVRVYHSNYGNWEQMGRIIDGEATDDHSGSSVNLSSDGSIVAIGAAYNDGNGADSGHVRIFRYNSGAWTQIGADIDGEAAGDHFGSSVSISSNGYIVAIGAPENDGNGTDSGHVRIYRYYHRNWTQIGSDINGEAAGDKSGYSVSLSSDGSIVAIGAPENDGNGAGSGHVRIYKNISGVWTQIGNDINGEVADDKSGWAVSLSSDGSIVAIGAPNNGGYSGHIRVFQNVSGIWTQIGTDIEGGSGDMFGSAVSLSSNGSRLVVGAPYADGISNNNNTLAGQIIVYENTSLGISELQEAGISIFPNPTTGVFNIKNAENYEITITDITGKIVYHTTATANEQIRLQQTGVYIIHFRSERRHISSKIIIE